MALALHGDAVVLRKSIGMVDRGGSVDRVVVGRFLIVQPSFSPFYGRPVLTSYHAGAEMRLLAHFTLDSYLYYKKTAPTPTKFHGPAPVNHALIHFPFNNTILLHNPYLD